MQYNLFAYCLNNPANLTDSNGNEPVLAIAIGAGIIGAIVSSAAAAVSVNQCSQINTLSGSSGITSLWLMNPLLLVNTLIVSSVLRASSSETEEDEEPDNHWGDQDTLQDHVDEHGSDFGTDDPDIYAKKVNDFYNNRSKYQVKVDEEGVTRVYDKHTNTFGSYNRDGSTRTFFKPSGRQRYFNNQPGK